MTAGRKTCAIRTYLNIIADISIIDKEDLPVFVPQSKNAIPEKEGGVLNLDINTLYYLNDNSISRF